MAGMGVSPGRKELQCLPHQCPQDPSQGTATIVKVSTRAPGVLHAQPRGTSPLAQPKHVAWLSPGRTLQGAKLRSTARSRPSLASKATGRWRRWRRLRRAPCWEVSRALMGLLILSTGIKETTPLPAFLLLHTFLLCGKPFSPLLSQSESHPDCHN